MLSTLLERVTSLLGGGADRSGTGEEGGGTTGNDEGECVSAGLYRCLDCGEVYLNDSPHSCSSCNELTVPAEEARARERERSQAERADAADGSGGRGLAEPSERGRPEPASAGGKGGGTSPGRGAWSRAGGRPGGSRRD